MNIRRLSTQLASLVICILLSLPATAGDRKPTPPLEPVGELSVWWTDFRLTVIWSIHYPQTEGSDKYASFIRQVQMPTEITQDMPVSAERGTLKAHPTDPDGARFELWTANNATGESYLLDTTTVTGGPYMASLPTARVTIRSEDPYRIIPRTRADRPFFVDVWVSGLHPTKNADVPSSEKRVTLRHHVQPFGASGTCIGLDRTQATLLHQSSITTNGEHKSTYQAHSIPGADRSKIRGEERFSVFSLAAPSGVALSDYIIPASELDSRYIQIWPVADGTITGITEGQIIGESAPGVTFTLNDLYPSSTTYAQVYKGQPQTGASGTMVPGSCVAVELPAPTNKVLTVSNYDSVIDSNGVWTMEVLTETPFGIDRLAHVSFLVEKNEIPQAQLAVSGNGEDIADGDISPSPVNHTDFGGAAVGKASIVRTFTIRNTGASPLVLGGSSPVAVGGGPHRTDFAVTRQPDSPVAAGDSTTFDVTFAPIEAGPRNTVLAIHCEAPVESMLNFAIQGTGITHESWRQTHFGSPENTGDGADLNDFDQDGIPNLMEFAFGLDPKRNSAGMLPAPQTVGNHGVISFTQPVSASGITYGAEWSTMLIPNNWQPIADTAEAPLHSFRVPIGNIEPLYMRLTVTSP